LWCHTPCPLCPPWWRVSPFNFCDTRSLIGGAREHKQQIGEAIHVAQEYGVDRRVESHHAPLGAAADGAGEVQRRSRRAAACENEPPQRRQIGFDAIDQLFESQNVAVAERRFGDASGALSRGGWDVSVERDTAA